MPHAVMSHKSHALQGAISVPGDKSISHRALILGALAEGRTEIAGLLQSGDVLGTAFVLQALGVAIVENNEVFTVTGSGLGGLTAPLGELDFGNSGTGVRLMMGVIAGHPFAATLTGDESLRRRPMGRVLEPLRLMGLRTPSGDRSHLPLDVEGTADLMPVSYRLPVPSAQVKSAILLAGLLAPGDTTVIEPVATRDHTERMLRSFGARISCADLGADGRSIAIKGQRRLKGTAVRVPGDPSSAAFPVAAALICEGSDVSIRDVLINPARTGFYRTLLEMGADLRFENEHGTNGERVADLRVRHGKLRGVTVPAARAPSMIDEYPCLAAVAAFAEGDTVMEGLSELRVKESDRLAAMAAGLQACGVKARCEGDTLSVSGSSKVHGGGFVETHMDHRIAMAFLVLGLNAENPVTVDDGTAIATSFPRFVSLLSSLGAKIEDADRTLECMAE